MISQNSHRSQRESPLSNLFEALHSAPPLIVWSADRYAPHIIGLALRNGIDARACATLDDLADELSPSAAAVVCAEEALGEEALIRLSMWVRQQPAWSDLPFLVLADGLTATRRVRLVEALGHVVILSTVDDAALEAALRLARHSLARRHTVRALVEALQAQLTQSEKTIRTVLETPHQYQGLLDADGTILYANTTALNGIDRQPEDVLGQPFSESAWFSGTPGMPERVRQAVAEVGAGRDVVMNVTLNLPTGEKLYDFAMRPVFDDRGKVISIVPEAVDITARAQAEDSLRQAQKMEAIGQLTGGVAHDFNNLLTVIKSSSEFLKQSNLSEPRRERYVRAISETTDRATKLTAQLLAFTRRQVLQPKVFDVCTSVRNVGDMVSTLCGARIEVLVELPDEPCFVDADPSQFDTALVNMVVNARDAMSGAGRLVIRVDCLTGIPAIRSHPKVDTPSVSVSVQDFGDGIAPEILERIFEPFFTTKNVGEGTGLGLSQVFGFAKQSDGEVIVRSTPGEGATFKLYLRRVASPVVLPPELILDVLQPGHGAFVLVVEDNRLVGQLTTQCLEELGYRSQLVGNASDALMALEAAPGRHDIVLSDVVLPGMDGLALGQEIQRLYPSLPIVLSSGHSEALVLNRDHGFDLLQKPYSIERLSKVLRLAVARKRDLAPDLSENAKS